MKTVRPMFDLTLISIFTISSIVGYANIANAQNITTGGNMTSNATKGVSQNDTSFGTAKELENLTGNNTQQFDNSALANLTTGISEKVSNFTGNNSALANLTTGISEKVSNLTGNLVGNQSGNKS